MVFEVDGADPFPTTFNDVFGPVTDDEGTIFDRSNIPRGQPAVVELGQRLFVIAVVVPALVLAINA